MRFYSIITEKGQSIYDIAVQEYGTADAVFTVIQDNPTVNLTEEITEKTALKIRANESDCPIKNIRVMREFRTNKPIVNNGFHQCDDPNSVLGFPKPTNPADLI